jgi:hypothetical protein
MQAFCEAGEAAWSTFQPWLGFSAAAGAVACKNMGANVIWWRTVSLYSPNDYKLVCNNLKLSWAPGASAK